MTDEELEAEILSGTDDRELVVLVMEERGWSFEQASDFVAFVRYGGDDEGPVEIIPAPAISSSSA